MNRYSKRLLKNDIKMTNKVISTKVCTKCKQSKSVSEFYKSSCNKGGYRGYCKICDNYIRQNRKRTKKGLFLKIYSTQLGKSVKRGHKPPAYTKAQLHEWGVSQPNFQELYDDWVASGYDTYKTPSVDRKDDYKGYSFDNIQLMTWAENDKKAREDVINGINTKYSKAVIGVNIKTLKIHRGYSVSSVARVLKGGKSCISQCCLGKKATAYGYIWKFSD